MTERIVSDAVVESLALGGVDVVFTLCGNHILPLQDALRRHGLRCIPTRSEAAAVFAADAYGRVSRRPGVALVTGGPGVSNTVTALLTARGNQSPVVLLSGEPATAVEGRGAQQEADHVLLTTGATKASLRAARAEGVLPRLQEAFRIAEHGTAGPVHLTIPVDVQREPAPGAAVAARRPLPAAVAPPAFVRAVADRVRSAARPVLVVGAGVWQHGGEQAVAALARETALPVFTLDSARGIVADGGCGCGSADPGLNPGARAIGAADCVVVAGREIDYRLGYGAALSPGALVVHVHPDPASLGRNLPDTALLCAADPAQFLADLADLLAGHRVERAPRPAERAGVDPVSSGPGELHPAAAADAVARATVAAGALFALDCGEFVQWCRTRIPAELPGRWLRLGPQATCGAGLPFGLGARAAAPGTPVVVIAGDGGLGYHVAELETAVRCELPLVVVVGTDRLWGVERLLQTGLYGEEGAFTSELTATDYELVARGFGCAATTVAGAGELEATLRDALAADGPRLIQVPIRNARSPATELMVRALRSEWALDHE